MSKGMGPCLCIAHVYLDKIVPRFCFYVHESGCMPMCCFNVLCESLFTSIYTLTHMYDCLVSRGTFRGGPKNTLN